MGCLDDIQTALDPLKKRKKMKYIFTTILGLAESFNTMNWPGPTLKITALFLVAQYINGKQAKSPRVTRANGYQSVKSTVNQ